MTAYFVVNERQYMTVVEANPPERFRPSVIVKDIPCYDEISGATRKGILVLPVSDEYPVVISLDEKTACSYTENRFSDTTPMCFVIKE